MRKYVFAGRNTQQTMIWIRDYQADHNLNTGLAFEPSFEYRTQNCLTFECLVFRSQLFFWCPIISPNFPKMSQPLMLQKCCISYIFCQSLIFSSNYIFFDKVDHLISKSVTNFFI